MGLLDDAIREHLDLKRRRGADPAEVERAEREALGPVRRNPSPGATAEAEESAAGGIAYDQDAEHQWADEPIGGSLPEAADEFADSDFSDSGSSPEAGEPEPVEPDWSPRRRAEPPVSEEDEDGWSAAGDGEFDPEPFPTTSGSRHRSDDLGDETTEFNVEAEPGHHESESDEDMLEETPEFLQDTPDHDRLWFEQRPPRDFDFDG